MQKCFFFSSLILFASVHLFASCLNANPVSPGPVSSHSKHLYLVTSIDKKTGKRRFGFIDDTGAMVIDYNRLPENILRVGEFHDGRAQIIMNRITVDETSGGQFGYIDETGKVVIAPQFYSGNDFREGLALVEGKDFRGYIDTSGKTIITIHQGRTKFSPRGPRARAFHDGLAAIGPQEGDETGLWGFIDKKGEFVIKPNYKFAEDFSEGLAGVGINGLYGFIDRQGTVVIQPRFGILYESDNGASRTIESGRFKEGLACVEDNNLFGYINRSGDPVIPLQFSRAQEFTEGRAYVETPDGKFGWIDSRGRWAITSLDGIDFFHLHVPHIRVGFSLDWNYSNGLRSFALPSEKVFTGGYMDPNGKVVIRLKPGQFGYPFVAGVAKVPLGPNDFAYGYINLKGDFIWSYKVSNTL